VCDTKTKELVIQRHKTNKLLQAAILSPMQSSLGQDLSVDQPTMQLDPAIVEYAGAALEEGQTHYVDVPGILPLRAALIAYLKDMGVISYEETNVLVTAGIQECRFLLVQMIGEMFGCVALPKVVHPGARKAAGMRQIEVKYLPVEEGNGMLPTLSGIREALEGNCKLLYLESPVRLTGATFDMVTVKKIASLIEEFDGAVIWDQGLAPWVENTRYASLGAQPDMEERVAVFGEAWPGVGLESLLIGYVAASENWVARMASQKQIMAICTSTPSQFAAVKAAKLYATLHNVQLKKLAQHRDKALKLTRKLNIQPVNGEAANIMALRVPDSERVDRVLHSAGFEFANGVDFGVSGVLRLSVTPDNTIIKALDQLT